MLNYPEILEVRARRLGATIIERGEQARVIAPPGRRWVDGSTELQAEGRRSWRSRKLLLQLQLLEPTGSNHA